MLREETKHVHIYAWCNMDQSFKPVPVKNFSQVRDALMQWVLYRCPIVILYRMSPEILKIPLSGDQGGSL